MYIVSMHLCSCTTILHELLSSVWLTDQQSTYSLDNKIRRVPTYAFKGKEGAAWRLAHQNSGCWSSPDLQRHWEIIRKL
jgi:hypothetical protein